MSISVALVLESCFSRGLRDLTELLAHHYTAAGCTEEAVVYRQRAGQHASDRSAHLEAISHVTTGIELLKTLPETPEHTQHAVTLHLALGASLPMAKGHAAPGRWSTPTAGSRAASRSARRQSWSRSCLGCGGFIWYGHSCTRRASSGTPCWAWRTRPTIPRSRSLPTMPLG